MSEDNPVQPLDDLYIPKRRRLTHAYLPGTQGPVLHLYYGTTEVCFDEPHMIPFGEQLLQHERFAAGSAIDWNKGEPYSWNDIKATLEALIEAGILRRGVPAGAGEQSCPFAMPPRGPRPAADAKTWSDPAQSGALMKELTGRELEPGYLEAVIPVYRLAHPALDAEGRQVGEANVFPAALRIDVPTEWRLCNYPGSRFQDGPMNVTALKQMSTFWKPILRSVLEVRRLFVERYPQVREGWTVNDLHTFACVVLSLPAYLTLRGERPVASGHIHPVISSMYRVTDGIRIVTHYLLFIAEQGVSATTPMTARSLFDSAERNGSFLSPHGVCAGPGPMVTELFATVVEGKPVAGGEWDQEPWLGELPVAFEYALLGLQVYALTFSTWVRMAEAYDRILRAFERDPATSGPLGRFRARLAQDLEKLAVGLLATSPQRERAGGVYSHVFDAAQGGLQKTVAQGRLSDLLTPSPGLLGDEAVLALREGLAQVAGGDAPAPLLAELAAALADYLRVERTILAAVTRHQHAIDQLLRRPSPERPLSGDDLALHQTLRVGTPGTLPYLGNALAQELGIELKNRAGATEMRLGPRTIFLK
jgi:hypothetical protein